MPEINQDEVLNLLKNEVANFVQIDVSNKEMTTLIGSPSVLRKILFFIGDTVWPDWYENAKGRKIYLKYAEDCKDGTLVLANKNFYDAAGSKIPNLLDLHGINYRFQYKIPIDLS